jgi:hypothetical protein
MIGVIKEHHFYDKTAHQSLWQKTIPKSKTIN